MKRLFTLLLISFTALSCEMIDEKIDDLLENKNVVIFAEGTELTVDVPSKQTVLNYKFESTLDWEVKTEVEWLEIDPMRGKAGKDIKIQIKVAKNKDKEGRTGYADLTLSNDDIYRITINQAGEGDENEDIVVDIPNNQIWYTSTDGKVVEPYSGEYNEYAEAITTFGVNIVSNIYADGKGVIEFDGDVTIIGDYAFLYCSNLTSVTIPDSVTEIGRGAFAGCENLEAVHITDLVSWCNIDFINPLTDGSIDFSANPLCYAKNLYLNGELVTDLVIPDGVNEIKLMAFALCESIKSVTIPNSVTTIGDWVFYNCPSLTSVTIGDSVTTIGDYAFLYCTSLTSVTIGDSVTTIGDVAFAGCSSLTSVTIPDSVTTIEHGAFGRCENLEAVHITDLVSWCNIDFINPFTDGSVDLGANPLCYAHNLYLNGELVTDLVIPDGVNEVKLMAFALCESIKSVTIPNSVTTIGDYAFYRCSNLTSVTIGDSVTEIGYGAFADCASLESVTIPDSVTTIGVCAFYGCSNLTSVTIPDSVTTIGNYAFYNCDSLTSVTIGDSVTTIGYEAFYECSRLTSVFCKAINPPTTIEDNNGYWYGFAMQDESGNICNIDCTIYVYTECVEAYKNAEGWNEYADRIVAEGSIPENTSTSIIRYTTIDGNPITPNNNMAVKSNTYTNGEGVLEFYGNIIGDSAFQNCYSLTSITIPDSVTAIGCAAFSFCPSLESVTIGDSVTTMGDLAFRDCRSLTSVTIGDSVTEIGHAAFFVCSSLTSITIPDSVTSVGSQAFNGCSSLTSVTIGDSVTTIERSAFADCTSLESVTIPDSVTTIGDGAFANCYSLTSITIPDSGATIGYGAFEDCCNLTSITIPDSVTTIRDAAFADCSSLQEFKGKFASEDGRCLIIDGTLNSFAPAGLIEYAIPDSVTTIGSSVFSGCSSLTSVTIGDSVTTIREGAFAGCSSLTSVTIPNSVTSIEYNTFPGCSSLQEFKGKFASEDGRCLIMNGVLNAFAPAGLAEYNISDGVTAIQHYAFQSCNNLTSVTIPDSVTTIGLAAFYGCTSLTNVTIGDSVTKIGEYAFRGCSSLTSVYCKAITPPVAIIYYDYWYAFHNNASGRKIYVPTESVEAYKSASYWSDYADAIVGYDF